MRLSARNILTWCPAFVGGAIAGVLVCLALLAAVTSDSSWDDYLISAVGVLALSLFVTLGFLLAASAFFPEPPKPRSKLALFFLVLYLVLVALVGAMTWFISTMSFL